MENYFYVYVFTDGGNPAELSDEWQLKDHLLLFRPIYVGKGKNGRIYEHFAPSNLQKETPFYRKLRKLIRENHFDDTQHIVKIYENLTQDEAWKKEEELIAYWGRKTVKNEGWGLLYNTARGGNGGDTLTNTNRDRAKEAHRKRMQIVVNDAYRKKCSEAHIALWQNRDAIKTATHIESIRKQSRDKTIRSLQRFLKKEIDHIVYTTPYGTFENLRTGRLIVEKQLGQTIAQSGWRLWFYEFNNNKIERTRLRRHVGKTGNEMISQERSPIWYRYPFLQQYEGKTFYQAGFYIEVYYKDQSKEALHGELIGRNLQ